MFNNLSTCFTLFVTFTLLLFCSKAEAQKLSVREDFMQQGSKMLLFNVDYYKTDNDQQFFEKAQLGVEGGVFFNRFFMASGGLELWTARREPIISLGGRFYPSPPFFVRYRAIIKDLSDVSFGIGYTYLLNDQWLVEASGDYFLNQNEFSFRVSFGILRPTNKKSP